MAKQQVEIELIKGAASYWRALRRLAAFFDHPPAKGTAAEAEFERLLKMVDRYEAEHHPVPPPDSIAATKFALDQRGTPRADRL